MISIWFFVALVVALVAVYLLGLRSTGQTTQATDSRHMVDGHDVKATKHRHGNGCWH